MGIEPGFEVRCNKRSIDEIEYKMPLYGDVPLFQRTFSLPASFDKLAISSEGVRDISPILGSNGNDRSLVFHPSRTKIMRPVRLQFLSLPLLKLKLFLMLGSQKDMNIIRVKVLFAFCNESLQNMCSNFLKKKKNQTKTNAFNHLVLRKRNYPFPILCIK